MIWAVQYANVIVLANGKRALISQNSFETVWGDVNQRVSEVAGTLPLSHLKWLSSLARPSREPSKTATLSLRLPVKGDFAGLVTTEAARGDVP